MGQSSRPQEPLIDKQIEKAATALKRYLGAQQGSDLLEDEDEFLYLLVGLQKSHPSQRRDKPIRIMLPHPLYDFKCCEVCLFVKDDKSGQGHKAAKKRLAQFSDRVGITKVVGTSKLRTKYESYESKRNLCRQFDVFLADDRILPSLPKLIGKSFFRKKKQPVPINMTAKNLDEQIEKVQQCTNLHLGGGSCLSVKIARAPFGVSDIVANVQAVLEAASEHVPSKWANVQSLFLKSADSVALPVYQKLPDASRQLQ
jgi:ribosome biogenesis protein UTP30